MKRLPAAAALSALLIVSACSSSGGSSPKTTTPPTSSNPSTSTSSSSSTTAADTIIIQNFAYSGSLTVAPGAKVTVIDKDSAAHTLTAQDGKFDTGNIPGNGGMATFTAPTTPGSYALICKYHPQMSGTLIVK